MSNRSNLNGGSPIRLLGWIAMLLALCLVFVLGSVRQLRKVNVDFTQGDQRSYVKYAEKLAESRFAYVGDRNRMPGYPALMALFYGAAHSEEEFFVLGKYVGIALATVVLLVALLVFRQVTSPFEAQVAVAVVGITVFAFKAPYFQADVLYYGLSFVFFRLSLLLLENNSHKTALSAGLVAGLCHLTKASILPGVVLVVVFLLSRAAVDFFSANGRRSAPEAGSARRFRVRAACRPLVCAAIVIAACALVIAPYISTSKERFGRYFYNVNSTFYMWCDSWREAKQFSQDHDDRHHWPDVAPEDTPGLSKYLREHDAAAIGSRLIQGVRDTAVSVSSSYGYHQFILLYLILLMPFFLNEAVRREAWHSQASLRKAIPNAFAAVYILGYFMSFAWYVPIASGNRFVLSLLLPVLFLILKTLAYLRSQKSRLCMFGTDMEPSIVSRCVLCCLWVYVCVTYPGQISTLYGGD